MRVLVVGGGGREHALVWKLSQSPEVEKIYCAPGNAGISSLAECVPINAEEIEKLLEFARQEEIQLTVVGPEAPLMAGIADLFESSGQLIFGPCREGALLEGSKAWAKEFMREYGIPTADFEIFDHPEDAFDYLGKASYPLVIKADGLAAGKGVMVAQDPREARRAIQVIMVEKAFGAAGNRVVLEEFLEGEEVSVFALADGNSYITFPSAQDHKHIYEGDRGPNTGGMGAYSPAPVLTENLKEEVEERIFQPVLEGLRKRGIRYKGVIYGGLMVTSRGVKVLEFNVRFGDPEAQVILPRLKSDLLPLLYQAARGNLSRVSSPVWSEEAAVCVVMASKGYPGGYEKGKVIIGLDKAAEEEKAFVFHAGTAFQEGKTVTSGGRVLGVTAWDSTLQAAVKRAYRLTGMISFEGAYYRRDIAYRALKRK